MIPPRYGPMGYGEGRGSRRPARPQSFSSPSHGPKGHGRGIQGVGPSAGPERNKDGKALPIPESGDLG